MKYFIAISILMVSSTLFAHGSIETITCKSKDNSWILTGTPIKKDNTFEIHISHNRNFIGKPIQTKLQLEDSVENKQIYENITIPLGSSDQALLKIAEIPSEEVRKGTGTLKLSKHKNTPHLSCLAVY